MLATTVGKAISSICLQQLWGRLFLRYACNNCREGYFFDMLATTVGKAISSICLQQLWGNFFDMLATTVNFFDMLATTFASNTSYGLIVIPPE